MTHGTSQPATPHARTARMGFTFVEVVLVTVIVMFLSVGMARSVVHRNQATEENAQVVAAFSLCKARLDEARRMPWDQLESMAAVDELIPLAQPRGKEPGHPIEYSRTTAVQTLSDPRRKQIDVGVTWLQNGDRMTQCITGVYYPEGTVR